MGHRLCMDALVITRSQRLIRLPLRRNQSNLVFTTTNKLSYYKPPEQIIASGRPSPKNVMLQSLALTS